MDTGNFKNIIGEAKSGEVATIRFNGKVTEESTSRFNTEFDYLENHIHPSLIRVLINSEGGSVLYGMNTFSTIRNSKVRTECVIEGIAASMGSIIWAAGDVSLMRDYAILMIHNPFLSGASEPSDLVKAFTKQIEMIYRKRFGLDTERVRSIMNGKAEQDGTFFDAAAAVKAGIIPAGNVLQTSKQLCDRVKNELPRLTDTSGIQDLMSKISAELVPETGIKLFPGQTTISNQTENFTNMNTEKTTPIEFAAVAATLGLQENYEVKDVMAKINELMKVEASLNETKKSLADAQIIIAGKDATISNLQTDLADVTASLTTYRQKEADEKKAKNEAMIEAAIEAGKISRDTKNEWMKTAEDNPKLVEKTLASILGREQISKEIANDPSNIEATAKAAKTAEELLAEQVNKVVGENFEFKTIQ